MEGKDTSIGTGQSLSSNEDQRKWSPGTAAFLSFLIPGWGQMYKGQVKIGIIWLVVTIACYFLSVLLGLFIHIFCTFEAAYVTPNK